MQVHQADTFRESVSSVLGAPPDPAPLQPQVLDVVAEKTYRREHIKYQSGLGDWSYAYLLTPTNMSAAAPTVICHHRQGIYKAGKAEVVGLEGDKNQAIGLELVNRGYVVFASDAIGYGERRSPDSDGEAYDAAYTFHQLALRLLRGETLLKKLLWDMRCAVDYLETRSEVDSRYLGVVGVGYGGKMALWTAAMEPRIAAAVAHGGVLTYREQLRRGSWFQPEFVVPRLMQVADLHHILSLVAPRPFLISCASSAQVNDSTEIYEKALSVYEKQGVANRLTIYRYGEPKTGADGASPANPAPAAHAISTAEVTEPSMRSNMYYWLDSWLMPY